MSEPDKTATLIEAWTALQGVPIDRARTAGAAAVITAQLAVEKAATAKLPFEAEPSNYMDVLHRGVRPGVSS
jgi:hypothetical protein